MSRRSADRNDGLQNAAGTLGQGADSNIEKNSAEGLRERCAVPHQARSLVSPDGEYQLSVDGCAFDAADAGHGHPLLSGMVPDAADRSPALHGVHFFDFIVLPGLAKRTLPPK